MVPERATRSEKKWRKCMGIEPTSPHGPKEAVFPEGGAESGALFGDDERLRLLLEAWAELPESVKDAIRALVLRSSDDFQRASKSGAKSGAHAAHNPAHAMLHPQSATLIWLN